MTRKLLVNFFNNPARKWVTEILIFEQTLKQSNLESNIHHVSNFFAVSSLKLNRNIEISSRIPLLSRSSKTEHFMFRKSSQRFIYRSAIG